MTNMTSIDNFELRLKAAGFEPDENSLKEMYAALPLLDAMRVRVSRNFCLDDEPAHVFLLVEPKS